MKELSEDVMERQEAILRRLQTSGSVNIEELCSSLETSIATVRRDLKQLEQRSLLRRTRGGAVAVGPLFYEPFRHDSSFQEKIGSYADEKRRIALAAAQLIKEGDTVALSGGTTTTEVVRSFRAMCGITVITNTVNVAMELSNFKNIEVIVTGGVLRGNWFTLVGSLANQAAQMMRADIMLLGVDGIDTDFGLSCSNSMEAEFLRTMAHNANRRVVVADRSKLGSRSKWKLCPTEEIEMLITDSDATDSSIAPFEQMGIKVLRV